MSKLLSSNFSRLLKDKVFWIVTAAIFALSAATMIVNGVTVPKIAGESELLNEYYFNLAPVIGLFYSVFISLFLGTEYSDGTIRNKLVIGHKRTDIYISNYIVCFAGTLVVFAAWMLGSAFGIPFFGTWQNGIQSFILNILIAVFITAALTAVFVMLSMLSTNKAITAVISIVLAFALMIIASIIYNGLAEPETTREFVSMSLDGIELGDEIPNPAYVSGVQRVVYEWLVQFLPTGQGILVANEEITNPVINIVYSIIITIAVNACGVFAFRKKDLK